MITAMTLSFALLLTTLVALAAGAVLLGGSNALNRPHQPPRSHPVDRQAQPPSTWLN